MALKGGKRFKILYVANNKYENREFQSLQECGLPNITGSLGLYYGIGNSNEFKGAFSGQGNSYPYRVNYYNDGGSRYSTILFNAKLSNNIYKDSHNDVTPYNFNVNLLVKI